MNKKPFSPTLKNKYDFLGKRIAASFFLSTGQYELLVPLNRQIEVYCKRDFQLWDRKSKDYINIESEVKANGHWQVHGKWGKYDTVHVPYRKKETSADYVCIINGMADTLLYVDSFFLKRSRVIIKDTRYQKNEGFYEFNPRDATFGTIIDGNWWYVTHDGQKINKLGTALTVLEDVAVTCNGLADKTMSMLGLWTPKTKIIKVDQ